MKKFKMMAIGILVTTGLNAQNLTSSQVPGTILTQFQKSYAEAANIEWEMKHEYYEVEFKIGRLDHEITYDKNGKIVKMEKDMSTSELPIAIAKWVKTKYPDYKIDEVEMKERNGARNYKVDIEKGLFKERKLIFDGNGKLLSDLED